MKNFQCGLLWTILFALLADFALHANGLAPSKCRNYTQFEYPTNTVEVLLNAEDNCQATNSTTKTSSRLECAARSEECVIGATEMEELINLLLNAQSIIKPPDSFYSHSNNYQRRQDECGEFQTGSNKRRKYSPNKISEECQQVMDCMKHLIEEIITETEGLIEWIIDDPGGCLLEIAKLNETVLVLNRQICQLKREHSETMDKLNKTLLAQQNCFVARFLERETQILQLKTGIDQERTSVIAAQVRSGQIVDALRDFHCQNNNSLLEPIATQAYSISSLEHLGRFASILSKDFQRMTIYNTTFKLMREKGDFLTLPITIFRKVLREEPSQNMPTFPQLLANVTKYANTLINNWRDDIISQNATRIMELINLGSPPRDTFAGWAFSEVLPELVSAVHSKSGGNLKILLDFAKALRWNIHKYVTFTAMYNIFSGREDKLQIILRLRDAVNQMDGPDPNPEVIREKFETFKNTLPYNIKSVIWNQNCKIRNRAEGYNYIRSGDVGYNQDEVDRPVGSDGNSVDDRTKWKIIPFLENNDEYQFRIQNLGTVQYLGSHSMWKEQNGSAGQCSTNEAEPCFDWRHFSWKIRYGGSDEEILLYHVGRKGYLYSNSILIHLVEDQIMSNGYWKIECDT